ncbi:SDR family NAD(P)-dependent oxidoreductase [Acidobacteria bacterium AH-259-A15]|nr:SDR family NAD(P)-dependent oxidoreductase [Acidobacteria bacterium AH-259-A15]
MNQSTKKVLITGASSGIGEATAYAFSNQKCELFLVARREDRLAQVAEACRQKGARQAIHKGHDLSIPGQGVAVVQKCLEELGGLDILICNAGYGIYGPVAEIPPEDMARLWQVNFQSGYESIYAALPHLLKQKRGHIVLVSSVIGRKALPYAAVYCVTKFAQAAIGEALWGELRGSGVGVSLICPGYTCTEFQQSAQRTKGLRSVRRLGGGQSPEVVAQTIVNAVNHNKREVHLTLPGKILILMHRLSPSLTTRLVTWGINLQPKR